MKYLPLVWAGLRRRKLRSLLTLLCILVAFVLFGYLCAIGRAMDQGASVAGADRLMVRHRVSITQPLPVSYKARIERIPGVALVAHFSWFGGIYREPGNFFPQMAVEPGPHLAMYPEYLLPEDRRQAWLATRTGAIAGRRTAEKYGWKVGDRIPIQATVWRRMNGDTTWEFDLVGIFDGAKPETDTTGFFFRYDCLDEGRLFGKGIVAWYTVRVSNPEEAADVARRIDEEFANASAETKSETEGAFLRGWARQIGDISTILASVLGAVFFTILLVAGNTMAQSVRERTCEIGVLKALGYTHAGVLSLVLAESCLLSVLGAAGGLAVASVLVAAGDPTRGAMPMFHFPAADVLAGLGWALALGVVAGLLPALHAMRLRVADALRRT
ncbi:MAG: FtsX-like permease family protein [Lentisphaerae bacterium]|nr:FtsX-like permease family protein [Lentisphaerota bacterium]